MRIWLSVLTLLMWLSSSYADDNIVIVFDTSGSMDEYMRTAQKTRLAVAQDALTSVLGNVPTTTKVGLLTFEGWAYPLGPIDQTKIQQAIKQCRASGGTPLYKHIKLGADRLLEEREKQGNVGYYKLIIVTDGEAQDSGLNQDGIFADKNFRPGYLKDIITRGIVVDAIGLEMKKDHSLKIQINGSYMKGDDADSIQQSLKKSVAEVGFNSNDTINEEVFKDVAQLPEAFCKTTISALTEFRNHPIGEKPLVKIIRSDGTIAYESDPNSVPGTESGIGTLGWIGIILLIILVIGVIVVILNNRSI